MDGNVKDSLGNPTHPPYPDDWYRRIVKENGGVLRAPDEPTE
jgi:dipeptidase